MDQPQHGAGPRRHRRRPPRPGTGRGCGGLRDRPPDRAASGLRPDPAACRRGRERMFEVFNMGHRVLLGRRSRRGRSDAADPEAARSRGAADRLRRRRPRQARAHPGAQARRPAQAVLARGPRGPAGELTAADHRPRRRDPMESCTLSTGIGRAACEAKRRDRIACTSCAV